MASINYIVQTGRGCEPLISQGTVGALLKSRAQAPPRPTLQAGLPKDSSLRPVCSLFSAQFANLEFYTQRKYAARMGQNRDIFRLTKYRVFPQESFSKL